MPVCEICESKDFELIATQIREGDGRIMLCSNCGLIVQDLDWDEGRLREYYESEYQMTNSLVVGQMQLPGEHFQDRLKTIEPIFEQIRPLLKPEAKVLEIGCGAGALLSRIRPYVSRCIGTELNTPFVDFIRDELGIEAYAQDVNDLHLNERFDLIISIGTLDHLPNPLETLLVMKNLLAEGGKIYIEVPNRNEALNRFIPLPNRENFNRFFWHRAHFFYFTRETITNLFKKAGLEISASCRHDYTLKNFLNWYFLGKPQPSYVIGTLDVDFFDGDHPFETRMNEMLRRTEKEFKTIMAGTFCGDNLCCIGWVEERRSL